MCVWSFNALIFNQYESVIDAAVTRLITIIRLHYVCDSIHLWLWFDDRHPLASLFDWPKQFSPNQRRFHLAMLYRSRASLIALAVIFQSGIARPIHSFIADYWSMVIRPTDPGSHKNQRPRSRLCLHPNTLYCLTAASPSKLLLLCPSASVISYESSTFCISRRPRFARTERGSIRFNRRSTFSFESQTQTNKPKFK